MHRLVFESVRSLERSGVLVGFAKLEGKGIRIGPQNV